MKIFVTGGAGFIGTHLVRKLQKQGHIVTVYDKVDGNNLLDGKKVKEDMKGHDTVYHLAANADTRTGIKDPGIDFEDGTVATHILLQAMKKLGIKNIVYTSSATFLPISLYGASKAACEAMISAYKHTFDFEARIYRMGNIIGSGMKMGVIHDLVSKLKANPRRLEVLGDGTAERSFLRVEDCVDGLSQKRKEGTYILSNLDVLAVKELVSIICNEMDLRPEIVYTGGKRGWKGDAPVVYLNTNKLQQTGWQSSYTSEEAVRKTVKELIAQ